MESQEEQFRITGGAIWIHRRSGMGSQEERHGVAGGAVLSYKKSTLETQEELFGVANFIQACFPPFYYLIY